MRDFKSLVQTSIYLRVVNLMHTPESAQIIYIFGIFVGNNFIGSMIFLSNTVAYNLYQRITQHIVSKALLLMCMIYTLQTVEYFKTA